MRPLRVYLHMSWWLKYSTHVSYPAKRQTFAKPTEHGLLAMFQIRNDFDLYGYITRLKDTLIDPYVLQDPLNVVRLLNVPGSQGSPKV